MTMNRNRDARGMIRAPMNGGWVGQQPGLQSVGQFAMMNQPMLSQAQQMGEPESPIMRVEEDSRAPEQGGGMLKAIGRAAKDYGPLALAGLSAWEGHRASQRQEELVQQAIAAEQEKQRMLQAGRTRRDAMQRPDAPEIVDPSNPYRRPRAVGRGAY